MTSEAVAALAEAARLGTQDAISEALCRTGRDAPPPTCTPLELITLALGALGDVAASEEIPTREAWRSVALMTASLTPAVRSQCAAPLRTIAVSVPSTALEELGDDPSPHARIGARLLTDLASARGRTTPPYGEEPPPALPAPAVHAPVPSVRAAAPDPAVPAQFAGALDDPNLAARIAAIEECARGTLDDKTARALADIALDDPFTEARIAALDALRSAPSAWRRRAAEEALASGDESILPSAARLLDPAEDEDAVIAASFLRCRSEQAAVHAAAVLAARAGADSVAILWTTLPGCPAPVRRHIVDRLREIDEHSLRMLARAAVRSGVPDQRAAALGVLGELADERVQPIIEALSDPSSEVRLAALGSIAHRPWGTEILDAVGDRVLDAQTEVREAAVGALRDASDARALPYLFTAAGDHVEGVRDAARAAIKRMSAPHVIDWLIRAMHKPDSVTVASELLVELGDAAIRAMIAEIAGADASSRERIGEILHAIGAGRHIRELLTDADPAVRCRAAYAIAAMGGRDATATLLGLLQDPEAGVRSHVVDLIADIDDAGAADELALACLREPHPAVADAMRRAASRMSSSGGNRSTDQESPYV